MPTSDADNGSTAETAAPAGQATVPADAAAATEAETPRRRLRPTVAAACVAVALLSAGSWTAANLSFGADDAGRPVVAPVLSSGSSPREPVPVARLDGTFYYYRADGGREQVWAWTVGGAPRLVADVGEPDDYAWEHYAWHTLTVGPTGNRLAWVPRGAGPVVVDAATGQRTPVETGEADLACLPPVWHPDGQRLLVRSADGDAAWFDVTTGQTEPIGADLSHACGVTVFTRGPETIGLAYEDHATRSVVAVTEAGEELWRVDVDFVLGRYDPVGEDVGLDDEPAADDPSWGLVDVSDGGGYVCLDLREDVAGGSGGEPALAGNVAVDTRTGAIVADSRPSGRLCWEVTPVGYVNRVDASAPTGSGRRSHQLRLVGYDGRVLAAVDEPSELYFAELIGYAPA